MPDVSVQSIDELEKFRAHLVRFNRQLAEEMGQIRGHWHQLGDIWNDPMYQRLGTAFDEVTPGIRRYLEAAGDHEAYLLELIARLRALGEVR